MSSLPACFITFVEIDHSVVSTIFPLPSADSRMVVVSYVQKCVPEVLDNHLDKLVQGKNVIR